MSYCPACKHSDPHNTLRGGHRQCNACLDEWCKTPRKRRQICTNKDKTIAILRKENAELRQTLHEVFVNACPCCLEWIYPFMVECRVIEAEADNG